MATLRIAAFFLALLFGPTLHAQDPKLSFAEAYALSDDRGKLVDTLLAGSESWYEYSCREKQAHGEFGAVTPLLAAWTKRYGRTPAVIEAENRQALLSFAAEPKATFEFLRQRLQLRFEDQPDSQGEIGKLATRLDPALITREAWSARALRSRANSLDDFSDSALFWLAQSELDNESLRTLLTRLRRSDVPGLPALIVRELALPNSRGFGALSVHAALRLEQLEACARLQPQLFKEPKFVAAWIARLTPDADSPWLHDDAARRSVLTELWEFAAKLPAVHNSLKAHVLYHLLAFELAQGAVNEQRFLEYLKLPRLDAHVLREYRDRFERECRRVRNVRPAL